MLGHDRISSYNLDATIFSYLTFSASQQWCGARTAHLYYTHLELILGGLHSFTSTELL